MGFTLCGKYFISYTEKVEEEIGPGNFSTINEYELYIWSFVPGQILQLISKHRIFKLKTLDELHDIKFMQFPSDPYKLICYGMGYRLQLLVYFKTCSSLYNFLEVQRLLWLSFLF